MTVTIFVQFETLCMIVAKLNWIRFHLFFIQKMLPESVLGASQDDGLEKNPRVSSKNENQAT